MKSISIITVNGTEKKVAFVKGNREISKKNLNQKITSIKLYGQLTDIIVVDGEEAIKQGLKLEDNDKKEVLDATDYVVIIDGQHRYKAIQELIKLNEKNSTNFKSTDIKCKYAYNPMNKTIINLIAQLNSVSVIWDGSDVVTGAALSNPDNEALKFAKELVDIKSINKDDGLPTSGYPLATIGKLLTFSSIINKKLLYKFMSGGKLPDTVNLDRAKNVLNAARNAKFSESYLSHKYFIDWVLSEFSITSNIDTVISTINKLTPDQVVKITNINSSDSSDEIRAIIKAA